LWKYSDWLLILSWHLQQMEIQQSTERTFFAPRMSPTKFHLSSRITDLDLDANTQIPTAEHSRYHPKLMEDINRMILAALQEQETPKTRWSPNRVWFSGGFPVCTKGSIYLVFFFFNMVYTNFLPFLDVLPQFLLMNLSITKMSPSAAMISRSPFVQKHQQTEQVCFCVDLFFLSGNTKDSLISQQSLVFRGVPRLYKRIYRLFSFNMVYTNFLPLSRHFYPSFYWWIHHLQKFLQQWN